ncbi:MAG: secondary thiamine-phosphate synthase enzyme YjbQ [Desulfobacterales bacterium]
MKTYRKELFFNVPTRRAFINITPEVETCLSESGITEGSSLSMPCTSPLRSLSMTMNPACIMADYDVWLEELAPHTPVSQYRHNMGENNADARENARSWAREVVVAVTDGRLDFGTWERIFYGEFDGRRQKQVLVKIIGD